MQRKYPFLQSMLLLLLASAFVMTTACKDLHNELASDKSTDSVATNIKMYSKVWDDIINKKNLAAFNDSNFTKDVVMHMSPSDIVGIDTARAYYANFINGFSDVSFTIKDIFGSGNKIVKHWNFSGTHTGVFFGIPASGKKVSLDGVTLVRMEGGKIAEERDFFDNLEFSQQLGLIPRQ